LDIEHAESDSSSAGQLEPDESALEVSPSEQQPNSEEKQAVDGTTELSNFTGDPQEVHSEE